MKRNIKYQISNVKCQNRGYTLYLRRREGYTLMELVVVMILLLVVGALVVGILNSTLRGNAKSKITNDLGQNGNYVLTVITDIILNSQNFKSITDSISGTVYTTCTSSGITGPTISLVGFDSGVTNLVCNGDTISSNSASLLDISRVKLVPGTCSFTCVQADDYSPPRIDVSFQLQNANGSSSDSYGRATFNTSLSLRNKILN